MFPPGNCVSGEGNEMGLLHLFLAVEEHGCWKAVENGEEEAITFHGEADGVIAQSE